MNYKLYNNDCLKQLDLMDENSIDSIVTDPPYELNFMGNNWDNVGISFQKETWNKCLRVLKPGGYLLAFGGSRTFHRIACAIEDAGFEIRDTIMWVYGSGFPKSMNISKSIEAKINTGNASTKGQRLNSMKNNYVPTGQKNSRSGLMFNKENYVKNDNAVEIESEEAKQWIGWGTQLKPSYEPIIVARKPLERKCD